MFRELFSSAKSRLFQKHILLGIFASVAVISLIPLHFANAQFGFVGEAVNWIGDIFAGAAGEVLEPVVKGLAHLFITILIVPAGLLFNLVAQLAMWLLGEVLTVGVIPGAADTPPFVQIGWEFARNFVNLLFLLILVFIGLATILRLQEYANQKTIAKLLIIALLVNFSPVLVGIIVDISNILTYYFVSQLGDLDISAFEVVRNLGLDYVDELVEADASAGEVFVNAVAFGIAMLIFFGMATLAFGAILLIFFFRLVLLWVLVILSPFAFAAYILPSTRIFWNRWISALIQWSIIGIPISFFLFLASHVLGSELGFLGDPPDFDESTGIRRSTSFIAVALEPFAAILLIFIGIGISFMLAPSGTQRIIRWGRRAAAVGAGVLGARAVYDFARRKARESERLTKLATASTADMAVDPATGQKRTDWRSRTKRAAAAPFMPTFRAAGRTISSRAVESERAEFSKAEEVAKKNSLERNVSNLQGRTPLATKLGTLKHVIKEGDLDDALKLGLSIDQVREVYNYAEGLDQHKEIAAALPNLVQKEEFIPDILADEDTKRKYPGLTETDLRTGKHPELLTEAYKKFIGGIKADRVKYLSKYALKNDDVLEGVIRGWDGRQLGNLYREQGKDAVDAIEKRLIALAGGRDNIRDWLQKEDPDPKKGGSNARLLKYLDSQAGRELGFDIP